MDAASDHFEADLLTMNKTRHVRTPLESCSCGNPYLGAWYEEDRTVFPCPTHIYKNYSGVTSRSLNRHAPGPKFSKTILSAPQIRRNVTRVERTSHPEASAPLMTPRAGQHLALSPRPLMGLRAGRRLAGIEVADARDGPRPPTRTTLYPRSCMSVSFRLASWTSFSHSVFHDRPKTPSMGMGWMEGVVDSGPQEVVQDLADVDGSNALRRRLGHPAHPEGTLVL